MVEWNGIFRLFRLSGILGQPREVHPKFRIEIPENVCSIRSSTRYFRNFWSTESAPELAQEIQFPTPRELSWRDVSKMWQFLRSAIFVLSDYIQFGIRVWNRRVVLINKFDKLELASKHIRSTNTESTSFWRIVLVRDFCVASDTWSSNHLYHLQRVCDKRATFVGRIVYFEHYANLKLIGLTLCCFYGWLVFFVQR